MADQKVAKPALQAALHLAMAGRVLCEGRSEVGAARVPAAQGALDVRGAQVVLELGLRQRAQERAAVIAGGEVQERARDRGGREAAPVGDVAWAQPRAVEHLEAGHRPASSRRGKRDHRGRGGDDAPAPGRRAVTEQCTIARGQQGGNEVPILGEQFRRHRRVHAAMDAVQVAAVQRATDLAATDARGQRCARDTMAACSPAMARTAAD